MVPKLSIQMYSLRAEAEEQGYVNVMKQVADMGYYAIEPAGFPGGSLEEAAAAAKELGLAIPSCHGALPVGENKEKSIEDAQTLGAEFIFTGCSPNFKDDFVSADSIKACADIYSEAAQNAAEHGIKVGYHNHWWEMADVDGTPGYKLFFEHAADDVLFEADTYWVEVGGVNAVELLRDLGHRVAVIHIKDGSMKQDDAMQALGTGGMDIPAICAASDQIKYVVAELDRCDTDMTEAMRESATYILSNGFAEGK
jgi:sugar phosphate isomerase/epimerase